MTIQDAREKINYVFRDLRERLDTRGWYVGALIILVGFSSFGLGRLSKLSESKAPMRMENPLSFSLETASVAAATEGKETSVHENAPQGKEIVKTGGKIVASKNGTKYHYPWCSGAQRIAEANKLWFDSVEEARKAGYTPASNCKGLR